MKLNIYFKGCVSTTLSSLTTLMWKENNVRWEQCNIYLRHSWVLQRNLWRLHPCNCIPETILLCHPAGLFVLRLHNSGKDNFFGKHPLAVDVLGNNKPKSYILLYFSSRKILNIFTRVCLSLALSLCLYDSPTVILIAAKMWLY